MAGTQDLNIDSSSLSLLMPPGHQVGLTILNLNVAHFCLILILSPKMHSNPHHTKKILPYNLNDAIYIFFIHCCVFLCDYSPVEHVHDFNAHWICPKICLHFKGTIVYSVNASWGFPLFSWCFFKWLDTKWFLLHFQVQGPKRRVCTRSEPHVTVPESLEPHVVLIWEFSKVVIDYTAAVYLFSYVW